MFICRPAGQKKYLRFNYLKTGTHVAIGAATRIASGRRDKGKPLASDHIHFRKGKLMTNFNKKQSVANLRRNANTLVAVLAVCAVVTPFMEAFAKDPNSASIVAVDRFSAAAGHLQLRSAENGLPGPNEPVDFDKGPFITQGIGPDGRAIRYYNFDVQPTMPAPIYVLFRDGEREPVKGQLNVVNVIPGDKGYSDFWQVHKVTVPKDYQANAITSLDEIQRAGYKIDRTSKLVNCPVVPDGSKARQRGGSESAELHSGWYKGMVVKYFTFEEKELQAVGDATPISPIYVTFNINPDQPNGGPGSGFRTEKGKAQTHNVAQTLPTDADYSPLWLVSVYDNKDWPMVKDLNTVLKANVLAAGVATVNCPIVFVDTKTAKLSMR
jgi:hypothetical protein